MKKKFGYSNDLAVPKLEKVTINIGASKALQDPKYLEVMEDVIKRITGQKPVKTRAKKSIAGFKIREGMVVGFKVTLRGKRMYEFVDKLVNITLPRVRDFRGLDKKMIDKQGNLSIGFQEYIAFPEIKSDEVEKLHGVQVAITTTAKKLEDGLELFKLLGFPIKE